MLKSISYSNKEKMNIKINVIIGFPNETHRDIWATLWFLVKPVGMACTTCRPRCFRRI